jgi:predicted nuclease with TOPRIM domain
MTIDERIEALTQSVELLAGFHRDSEVRMANLEGHMAKLTETMDRLANIVIRHEERLDDLDSR